MQQSRRTRVVTACLAACGIVAGMACLRAADATTPDADALRTFEEQVRPVLSRRCVSCHGGEKQEGGLRLDTQAGLAAGGDSGPVLEAGDPEASLLIAAVRRMASRCHQTLRCPLMKWLP